MQLSRRDAIRLGALGAVGLGLGCGRQAVAETPTLIRREIPASGERIAVIGLGTTGFSVSAPDELAARSAVLKRLVEAGASVVDTAPAYGESESALGGLIAGLGVRDKVFLATKITRAANFEESLRRLRTDHVDLLQVHSLQGTQTLLPLMAEWKAAKRIRYLGVTTSRSSQHAELIATMHRHPLDFIQVNYSIADRDAAGTILPLAHDRGIAVLVNVPFGGPRGRNLFRQVGDRKLPPWAADLGIASWGQFFLKYVVSHPAVTCAIPGTTRVEHLEDNLAGGSGLLPPASVRARMEAFWDAI
jgi:aryl-alcohol dehydrogenase-like predicted oxidoreductase